MLLSSLITQTPGLPFPHTYKGLISPSAAPLDVPDGVQATVSVARPYLHLFCIAVPCWSMLDAPAPIGMCVLDLLVLDLTFILVNPLWPMCFRSCVYLLAVNKCSFIKQRNHFLTYILPHHDDARTTIFLYNHHPALGARQARRTGRRLPLAPTHVLGRVFRRVPHL